MSASDKMQKNSSHCRNGSEELDVFEAARYFSTSNENQQGHNYSQKMISENFQRPARMSLDMPMMRHAINPPHNNLGMDQRQMKENKKYKQPSSPGGRLANFLNSLFNQTTLKKKKSKSNKDLDHEEENPVGIRRKRRSSISHFKITSSKSTTIGDDDSKSLYNSSINSGFRTPPPYANTPNKSYKEFRNFSEQQKVVTLPKSRENYLKPTLENEIYSEKISSKNIVGTNWINDEYTSEEREFRKFSDGDDGADSDSSSDLFDLPNHDLDFYPTGLPVYETTHMDRIKIGAPISTA